jgi:predicted permease
LGRGFQPEEDFGRNAHPVAVISHQLWRDRFQGDPNILGRTQMMNGTPHTIVGVAPDGFAGTFVGYAVQFWAPSSMQQRFHPGGYMLEDRGARWIEGFARLKPGVTRKQAQAEISAVAQRLEATYPVTNRGRGVTLLPLWESPFNSAALLLPTLSIALAVVGLVLLIACANVANLLLVRSLGRRQEMTIRLAVGAGRARLIQQLLSEGLVLAAIASAGGLLLAVWCRNALVLFFPPSAVALNLAAEIDWRVLAFSVAICLTSTLLFGLAPALNASKVDLVEGLKAEAGGVVSGCVGGGRRQSFLGAGLRSGLVLVQVALSFILLVGGGLLIKTLRELRDANPGFETRGVLNASVDLFAAGYEAARGRPFLDELGRRVQAFPGVDSVAFARVTPLGFRGYSNAPISTDGYQAAPDEQPSSEYNDVSPAYFRTLGIPLLDGREFSAADTESSPLVAVVNESLAARYWPGQNPVGKRLQVKGRWMQVVGLARNAKYRTLLEPAKPFFYVPLRQAYSGQVSLHIRTRNAPETIASALTREVHSLDPGLAPSAVASMQSQIEVSSSTQRIAMLLLGVFASLALLLACVGLYSVMSYTVSQGAGRSDCAWRSAHPPRIC